MLNGSQLFEDFEPMEKKFTGESKARWANVKNYTKMMFQVFNEKFIRIIRLCKAVVYKLKRKFLIVVHFRFRIFFFFSVGFITVRYDTFKLSEEGIKKKKYNESHLRKRWKFNVVRRWKIIILEKSDKKKKKMFSTNKKRRKQENIVVIQNGVENSWPRIRNQEQTIRDP